jgi:hypothetical protein
MGSSKFDVHQLVVDVTCEFIMLTKELKGNFGDDFQAGDGSRLLFSGRRSQEFTKAWDVESEV